MSDVHSSLVPRYQPLGKSVLGRTRVSEKLQRRAEEARQIKACYAAVDARDQGRCRVCGRRCSPTALALVDRAERHHLVFRSQGGSHEPENVVTVCKAECHAAIHSEGVLRLSGDANARNERGVLCGVCVEAWRDAAGWVVTGWV